ncbi:hypothetical protein M2189_007294 [Bradyrhizobium japonicum]|nr:hypothetical protein [Bradyrhizobium japonicum]
MAELARLIGQTDPFAAQGRPSAQPSAPPAQSYQDHDYPQDDYRQDYAEQAPPAPPGPPSWMRRANVQPQPAPEPDYPVSVNPVHPLHRYSAQPTAPEPDFHQPQAYQAHAYQDQAYQAQAYQGQAHQGRAQQHDQAYQEQAYQEPHQPPDPARYDDALYGRLEGGEQDYQRDPAYPDDPYAFQSDYPEADLDEPKKSRGGMMTVAAILALAVVGTGAAFAYKTYVGSPRSGEPPIIKADNTPTKIVPAPTDSSAKVPDRMASGDGSEKIVPREEAPVDVAAKAGGPRVVFPPLNQNANPPSVASVAPSTIPPPSAGPIPSNGTLPANTPRAIRTVAVRGDQTDSTAPQSVAAKAGGGGGRAEARCRARGTACATQSADFGQCQRQSAALARAAIDAGCGGAAADGCDQPDATHARQQWWRLRRAGLLAAERGQRGRVLPGASEQIWQRAWIALAGDQAG